MQFRHIAGHAARAATLAGWTLPVLLALFSPAWGADDCVGHARLWGAPGSAINLRVDNDLFGGSAQDQGYSNGLQLSLVTPDLTDYRRDPCLPGGMRRFNGALGWLQPDGDGQRNMVFSLAHAIFTPNDPLPATLIEDDRPYAAILAAGVSYNLRRGDELRTNYARLGVVGPAALGRQVQDSAHHWLGSKRFYGWRNQLRNEPVLQFGHERLQRRMLLAPQEDGSGLASDLIVHWGAAVGNLSTHANTGLEWRLGWRLPDDFGSAPLRPAGESAAPGAGRTHSAGTVDGHFFVVASGRWVLRDITLDGNTFRSSHHVDRRPWVADIGYGFVVNRGHWKFAFARYQRSREFSGQRERPVYGSFSISRRF
ncbi:lipid A deacylase LpxR family protein [Corticibacter populi]|uniref:Lipid A deacylase LpxR family protein n=1 Tax=Corticibacter populi TaxID=1550736 RepID=A0A3M6QZJ4_9BURK|nr:lipid A deacylase LpxR family protein [Corticibacter populi]RMX08371.1 lipid A deacylase LpxR family protein [Corticibacter populi]RZS35665.1 hypothetical protein EV687_0740 [Corticibacter populi]